MLSRHTHACARTHTHNTPLVVSATKGTAFLGRRDKPEVAKSWETSWRRGKFILGVVV